MDLLSCGHLFTCSPAHFWVHPLAFMFEKLEVYRKTVSVADS
jgi:hypothetical protein